MINIGIAGTGFGLEHYNIIKQNNNVKVIGVFGRSDEKLNKIEDPNVIKSKKLGDFLIDKNTSFIDICLPTKLHTENVNIALGNGKNVFCETPLCENEEELNSFSIGKGQRLYVSSFLKYFVEYEYLRNSIFDGKLGKLINLRFTRFTPPIWGNLGLENIVLSLMIHEIDFITWTFGVPANINVANAFGKQGKAFIQTLFEYRDFKADLAVSSYQPGGFIFQNGYEAMFERGFISFQCAFPKDKIEKKLTVYDMEREEVIELPDLYPYKAMLDDVIECEMENKSCRLDFDYAKKALYAAFEINEQIKRISQ